MENKNKDDKLNNVPYTDQENAKDVDKILEFYKQDSETPTEYTLNNTDEEIHDSSYGLNRRGRSVITYIVTGLICAIIIAGSYIAAIVFPSNDEATEEYAETLRQKDSYKSIKDEYNKLTKEVKELSKAVSDKKDEVDAITEPDNIKAELRNEISQKSQQLKELNGAIKQKNDQLAEIDNKISSISGKTVTLSPGRYTVGKDIAAGKYNLMGLGSFSAASSDGKSKYNTTLSSSPFEVELSSGDKLKLDCTVKFTPIS